MPKVFYHYCGPSGVGKKTLVKKLVDNTVDGLRKRFGIEGQFGTYAFYGHPGIKEMWQYASANEEIVVHNWQLASHGWIAHNMRVYPDAEQKIYLLWQPFEVHSRNLIARAEKAPSGSDVYNWRPQADELRKDWNTLYVPLFRQVESWGLEVQVIDASTGRYDALPAWPD